MAGGLIIYGNGVLYDGKGVRYGTATPDCCCYEMPGECPPCCLEISDGNFDANGDLVWIDPQGDVEITHRLVMPQKNKRLICFADTVTAEVEITSGIENMPDDKIYRISWDRAYRYSSHTGGGNVHVFPGGMVEWNTTITSKVSVTLIFNSCYSSEGTQYGDITTEQVDRSSLYNWTGYYCATEGPCCPVDYECDPCCVYLDPTIGTVEAGNTVVLWTEADGWKLKTIIHIDPLVRELCQGDPLTVDYEIIPPTADALNGWQSGAVWTGENWRRVSYSPIPCAGGGTGCSSVNWGACLDTEYTVTADADCVEADMGNSVCPFQGWPPGEWKFEANGAAPASLVSAFTFIECPNPSGCLCCCPPPNCICDAIFPMSEAVCTEFPTKDRETGGPTQIKNLSIEVQAQSGPWNGLPDGNWVTVKQNGPSIHFGTCGEVLCPEDPDLDKQCPQSNGTFSVPVIIQRWEFGNIIEETGTYDFNYGTDNSGQTPTPPCGWGIFSNTTTEQWYPYWKATDGFNTVIKDDRTGGEEIGVGGYQSTISAFIDWQTTFDCTGSEECPTPP